LTAHALQGFEIDLHLFDGRVQRSALPDAVAEQREAASLAARLAPRLDQFVALAGNGAIVFVECGRSVGVAGRGKFGL
jgi:hypothetical protein